MRYHPRSPERDTPFPRCRDSLPHPNSHDAPSTNVQPLTRFQYVDDRAREIERIGALINQHYIRSFRDHVAQHAQRTVIVHRHVIVLQPRRHGRCWSLLADGVRPGLVGAQSSPIPSSSALTHEPMSPTTGATISTLLSISFGSISTRMNCFGLPLLFLCRETATSSAEPDRRTTSAFQNQRPRRAR